MLAKQSQLTLSIIRPAMTPVTPSIAPVKAGTKAAPKKKPPVFIPPKQKGYIKPPKHDFL